MILVTGHRGFIGSRLFELVGGVGIDLKDGLDLLTCPLPEADIIYHLAAQSSVEASWKDPVLDSENIRMTVRLASAYPNAKIIYTNSAAASDPKSPYGFSKFAAGDYLKRFHANAVICTLPNVYGPGSKSVVDIFKGANEVTIFGDGLQLRDYVHVDDIVRGLQMASRWPAGEYQLGSGIATNLLQLAGTKKIVFAQARKEARESVLSNTTPEWEPTIDVFRFLAE
jgi:nucleoside-diphosphate-sugar epimerase